MLVNKALVVGLAAAAAALATWLVTRQRKLQSCPTVPVVPARIPFVRSTLSFATNPRKFLEEARLKHGDTFIVEMLGLKLLFVFSAQGVRSLYRLPENDASFTEATRGLLGLKIPQEIIAEGDLRKFHVGLKTPLIRDYLIHVHSVVNEAIDRLGLKGQFNVFVEMKKIVFQIGLRCWVGKEVAISDYASELSAAFETLDPETAFQDLRSLIRTWTTGKRKEKAAIRNIENILRKIWESREPDHTPDNLTALHSLYSDLPLQDRYRRVSYDVFHFLVASQANLYAAMSWSLIYMLNSDPIQIYAVSNEIRNLAATHGPDFSSNLAIVSEQMPYCESFVLETLRLVQQSLTLRKVLNDVTLDTEIGSLQIPAGVTIATLLSITNVDVTVLPDSLPLNEFHPERYQNGTLRSDIYSPELSTHASTFGHGRHGCPGRLFALSTIKCVLSQFLLRLELVPRFNHVDIPQSSVGAIARASHPCIVEFRRK